MRSTINLMYNIVVHLQHCETWIGLKYLWYYIVRQHVVHSAPTRYTVLQHVVQSAPTRGMQCPNLWYILFQHVVHSVPTRGTQCSNMWYTVPQHVVLCHCTQCPHLEDKRPASCCCSAAVSETPGLWCVVAVWHCSRLSPYLRRANLLLLKLLQSIYYIKITLWLGTQMH